MEGSEIDRVIDDVEGTLIWSRGVNGSEISQLRH